MSAIALCTHSCFIHYEDRGLVLRIYSELIVERSLTDFKSRMSTSSATDSPKHRVRAALLREGRTRSCGVEASPPLPDDANPEICVQEFYRCRNLPSLRKILRKADTGWMTEFVENGGLAAIFESLSALGKREVKTLANVLPMLECVECLKAVMNSEQGLDYIVRSSGDEFVNKLVMGKLIFALNV